MSDAYHLHASTVPLPANRPLLIVDADEVLLRFADGFDRFLRARQLFLDLTSYRLHGNVKRLDDRKPVLDVEVTALLDEFRADLDSLEPVEGAGETMRALRTRMNVVVLSNITAPQAAARIRNLATHGLDFPLLINNGGKGAAVKALAARTPKASFFIDDIPQHHASVAESAPEVFRIHLIGDARLKPLLALSPHAHFRAETWNDAHDFIAARLNRTE